MSKMNKQLIKAGLYYLINKDKETFLERMSMYLQERSELMDFLFEGPLPIDEEVVKKIEEYIKFRTVKENISSEIVEKKSKFIANIFYVESIEEAENHIKQIKKKYNDARHNCFAYAIETRDRRSCSKI